MSETNSKKREISSETKERPTKRERAVEEMLGYARERTAIKSAKEYMKEYNKSDAFQTWVNSWNIVRIENLGADPDELLANEWKLTITDRNNNRMVYSYWENVNGDDFMTLEFTMSNYHCLQWKMEGESDENKDVAIETVKGLGFNTEAYKDFSSSLGKMIDSMADYYGVRGPDDMLVGI